jgi:diaminohydroxyphosphoribosylaminopyrimidine deaminase / 5-amino-6-(5-phosphoribosylamino)uracil reductase
VRQPILPVAESDATPIDLDRGWQLLLALAERARAGSPLCKRAGFAWTQGAWQESRSEAELWVDPERCSVGMDAPFTASEEARSLFQLFMPLVLGAPAARLVVGHLGQSLDGRVATLTGASQFITGREDVLHTHRLRALCDAVVVGVRTVQLDDPQLTTRLVPGAHPTRVVLDPQGKLAGKGEYKVLADAVAHTLIVSAAGSLPGQVRRGHVEWVGLASHKGRFDLRELLRLLRARGLARVFVEGGGVTVSRFLAAGLLHRLHVGVAPLILGSGAPAFALPPIERLDQALNLRCRHFSLGSDMLFDCELLPSAAAAE